VGGEEPPNQIYSRAPKYCNANSHYAVISTVRVNMKLIKLKTAVKSLKTTN